MNLKNFSALLLSALDGDTNATHRWMNYCSHHQFSYVETKIFRETMKNEQNMFRTFKKDARVFFLEGLIHEADEEYSQAMECYNMAIKHDSFAKIALANLYLEGLGCVQNTEKAIQLLEEAIKSGNSLAMLHLADLYFETKDEEENAMKLLALAVESGNAVAMNHRAEMYLAEKNYEKALQLFYLAADAGDLDALKNLAIMKLYGIGCDVDYQKAFDMFNQVVDCGDPDVINTLAFMHMKGLGCQPDHEKAYQLLNQAVDDGDSDAMYNLAFMHAQGYGCKQDYDQARKFFNQAVKHSDVQGELLQEQVKKRRQGLINRLREPTFTQQIDDEILRLRPYEKESSWWVWFGFCRESDDKIRALTELKTVLKTKKYHALESELNTWVKDHQDTMNVQRNYLHAFFFPHKPKSAELLDNVNLVLTLGT